MTTFDPEGTNAPTSINWRELASAALSSAVMAGVVSGGILLLARLVEEHNAQCLARAEAARAAERNDTDAIENVDGSDEEIVAAAELLGVTLEATADEVRSALRVKMMQGQIHPDHGGDGVEARRLIAARDLLLDRLRDGGA